MSEEQCRLLIRSDFDGIVCAVLLKKIGIVGDEVVFVHPKDMQDGNVEVTGRDVTANLPYVEGAHLVFDHHLSETLRVDEKPENYIINPDAPSAAQVIYEYYGGEEQFPDLPSGMMDAVNKADSAQFTEDDILDPEDWVLLHFIMDPRTGLGRVHNFRISNLVLMERLIGFCAQYAVDEIMLLPDVKERVEVYFRYQGEFRDQLQQCARVYNNLVVLDLSSEEVIYPGNRFVLYTLFPECNISIHVLWGKDKQKIVFATGRSIFNRTSEINIGELMLQYGGGGHAAAGTCQIETDKAESVLAELIQTITA